MSDRLTDLIPTARTLTLGGRAFEILPARIRDLAKIQQWLDLDWEDPLTLALDQLVESNIQEGPEFKRIVRQSLERFDVGPPVWDQGSGRDRLYEPEGAYVTLCVAFQRSGVEATVAELVRISHEVTDREMSVFRRTFFGIDSRTQLERMLAPESGPGRTRPCSWMEAIEEVARERHLTNDQVYDMTIAEFRSARTAGKPRSPLDIDILPGESLADAWRRAWVAYHGTEPPSEEPPTPETIDDPMAF